MKTIHQQEHGAAQGNLSTYIVGFLFSILLTGVAFSLVYLQSTSGNTLFSPVVIYGALVLCAIIQLFVQLFYFLHVGKESKSHWNLTALSFALIVVSILVGGTLWIMWNLQHINAPGAQEPFENGVVTPQTEG